MRQFGIITQFLRCISIVLCMFYAVGAMAQTATDPLVSKVDVQSSGGLDRIVLHISQAISYDAFGLSNPGRIVIDMPLLNWKAPTGLPANYNGMILKNIRIARFNATTMRMVFDLALSAELDEVSVINQGVNKPFLMVFDVVTPEYTAAANPEESEVITPAPASEPLIDTKTEQKVVSQNTPPEQSWRKSAPTPAAIRNSSAIATGARPATDWAELAERASEVVPLPENVPFATAPVPVFRPQDTAKRVVVIDAGHGGRDPGATGVKGTKEKEVTLYYAKALRDALLSTGRYDVELTRDYDTYVMLRERLAMGRRAKGDIFISVHADAAENHSTRGLSIYTLSETASDKEAAALATRENKVDIIYGMNLSSEHKDVTEILIDLAQRETKNKSTKLAEILLEALGKKVKLLPNTHRYAGFAVLKAPDVPSVLIELGFLSNRKDEALITSSNYRKELVSALVLGIDNYFSYQKNRQ
ncbi:MAG: N-acetylmuramoyl-L-alanine amidase [Alphaproteobacteria bacterium]|nr:N-acetylmuramoyl-L-alanine amidase [Alphaproteobacteria bacterium]